jgi:hypothetical protein
LVVVDPEIVLGQIEAAAAAGVVEQGQDHIPYQQVVIQ